MKNRASPRANPTNPTLLLLESLAPTTDGSAAFVPVVVFVLPAGVLAGGGAETLSLNISLGNNTLSTWYTANGNCCLNALLICVVTAPLDTLTWLPPDPVKLRPYDPPPFWAEA